MSAPFADLLLDGLLKGSVILLLAWACVAVCGRSSAATRYAVWRLAFAAVVVLPVLTAGFGLITTPPQREAPPDVFLMDRTAPVSAVRLEAAPVESAPRTGGPRWTILVVAGWLAGAAFGILRLMKDLLHVALLTRSAVPFQGPVGTRGPLPARIRTSDGVNMPMVWGVRRPVVLLPREAEKWPTERLRLVLAHELAHVERGDYLTHLIVQVACAIYWMNPLVWTSARKLCLEQERACDDLVVGRGAASHTYARHLLDLARAPIVRGAMPLARPSTVRNRILAILNSRLSRRPPAPSVIVLSMIVAASLTSALAALPPVPLTDLQQNLDARENALKRLSDPSVEVRRHAAWTLGEIEHEASVEALIAALRDEAPSVQGAAAWALGEIKSIRATNPLAAASRDHDAVVREMAVRALGEIEVQEAAAPLIRALEDPNPDVRASAVWALGEHGGDAAATAVAASLADESERVRVTAAVVLSQATEGKHPAILDAIRAALSDPSAEVRRRAAVALGKLDPAGSVEALSRLLGDSHPSVRLECTRVLGEIGDPAAVDALLASLRDPHPDVRAMAVWALDEINVH